ncbi:hypothetical protein EDC90_100138 [Martelella mediterranea]|uniref:Uncharacterized protein n=1 Tax=Martelella mediterranea TaxID=293089 RepID=A0A4V2V4Z1_9HYPH|nr:hypothetical protein EDC90_100138 [Martelella mediterranea]
MAQTVNTPEKKTVSARVKPHPHKIAPTDDSKYAADMAHRNGRPCESSAVFEAWAQH